MIDNDKREFFKKSGYAIIKYDDKPIHSYPYDTPWLDDGEFNKLYNKIHTNTLVDRIRCYSIYQITKQYLNVPGNILEVGTWRGGTAGIFTTIAKNKTVYLADTFKGVVKSSEWEHYNDFAHNDTSEALVREFLIKDLDVDNFKILKGVFPDKTGQNVDSQRFAIVYLDLDVYKSTKDAFNYIWDKVSKNGIVIFDDYGMISACEGISKFVNEIKDDNDKIFLSNLNGQAYIIKK